MLVKVRSNSQSQKHSQVRRQKIHRNVVGGGRRNLRYRDCPPMESANSVVCVCVFLGSFNRRKRNSLYVTVTLLIVSVLILTVGLAATTRTQNVTVGGYYPGVIVSIELLGRSRKLIAYEIPCNDAHVIKGDLVLNITLGYFIAI